MTEEEKAERRTVIENNKAWDAAEKVRRGFLKDLLAAKSMPKDALQFIAQAICTDGYTASDGIYKYSGFTAELLGGSNGFGELARVAEKPGRKADSIILAAFLAGYEQNLSRQSWRTPTDAEWRYLTKLGEWGYALSDVERIITEK